MCKPKLLLIACFLVIARIILRTKLPVNTLFDQYGFERSISKDDSRSKEAVDAGNDDLNCSKGCKPRTLIALDDTIQSLFAFDTPMADTGSCVAAGGTQSVTGLKLIFLCSTVAGEEPRGRSQDSIEDTLCRDMMERRRRVQNNKPSIWVGGDAWGAEYCTPLPDPHLARKARSRVS